MRRGAKPAKAKVAAKPSGARKSRQSEGSTVSDLEKRLAEAQEQQAAAAEILRVISRSQADLQRVFDTIAQSAVRLCGGVQGNVVRFDGELVHRVAGFNLDLEGEEALRDYFPRAVGRELAITRAILDGSVVHLPDALQDADHSREITQATRARAILAVPMLRDGQPIGAIAVVRREALPFSESQIVLLQTFADQAVIAIENVRLFTELQEKNRALTHAHAQMSETLDRQTATADVLRIIAQSPTELQPVLDAIAKSAVRLCAASDAVIERLEGDRFYNAAHAGSQMKGLVGLPLPLTRRFPGGRAVLDGRRVIIDDIHLVAEQEYPDTLELLKLNTIHSVAEIPLLSEGKPLGTIAVLRAEVRPFTDSEVTLLETFADQAVIAIENVRLFKELQSSNRYLTRALDQQTATSEVLRTIAQTKTDLQPVLDEIVRSAVQLCHAHTAAAFLTDGQTIHLPASYDDSPEALAAIKARFPRPLDRETAAGTAILTRSVIHVPDVEEPTAVEFARQTGRAFGFRSLLSMPMVRQDEALGAINVTRREPGPFSEAEVALLKTFADQAVIALENVRLFRELEGANRELSAASQHKSEFLANMSHELRTPLNAIIGFSEVLTERMFGDLNEKQEEYLKDIYASGTHLLSLINDILDLSKIEAGRMELELTDFHLPQAIDNALTLVRERAGRRGIALEHAVDERLGEIRGDERKVKQVLLNLLSNALKFTPEGGRVDVRAGMVDGMAEISVTDTGVGIAPEDQGAIFEEFRQVGTADKKAEGTGLGLTLCRKFIELHGGKIWVKSQVGGGSTFTFTIPMRQGE